MYDWFESFHEYLWGVPKSKLQVYGYVWKYVSGLLTSVYVYFDKAFALAILYIPWCLLTHIRQWTGSLVQVMVWYLFGAQLLSKQKVPCWIWMEIQKMYFKKVYWKKWRARCQPYFPSICKWLCELMIVCGNDRWHPSYIAVIAVNNLSMWLTFLLKRTGSRIIIPRRIVSAQRTI